MSSTACAEAHDVLDEAIDIVVIATGGLPNVGHFTGSELATTSWDVLAGNVELGRILVWIVWSLPNSSRSSRARSSGGMGFVN
jgi:hypothetical protein